MNQLDRKLRASDGACLVLLAEAHGDTVFPLRTERIFIGRSIGCEVSIADPRVSALHAEVVRVEAGWLLRDLCSKNGTRVNGEAVRERVLRTDDRIDLGGAATLFFTSRQFQRSAAAPAPRAGVEPPREIPSETAKMELYRAPEPEPVAIPLADLAEQALGPLRARGVDEAAIALLQQIGRGLGARRGEDAVLDGALDLALTLFPADSACVFICDADAPPGRPRLAPAAARARTARVGVAPPVVSRTIVEEALFRQSAIATRDATCDARFQDAESVQRDKIRAVMSAPIVADREVLGVLYVEIAAPGVRFGRADLQLLSAIAYHTALALANARYVARLEERARRLGELLALEKDRAA